MLKSLNNSRGLADDIKQSKRKPTNYQLGTNNESSFLAAWMALLQLFTERPAYFSRKGRFGDLDVTNSRNKFPSVSMCVNKPFHDCLLGI